jgi:hypothetical protein
MYDQQDYQDPDPYQSQVRNQMYARLPGSTSLGPSAPSPTMTPAPWASPGVALGPSPTESQKAPAPSPFNYEAARDSWMSGQYGKDEAGAARWAGEHGIQYSGGDTINLPNGGGLIDILGNFKSGQNVTNNWTAAGNNGSNPNGAAIGAGGMPGATGASPGGSDFTSQIRALLMSRLGDLGKPVTEDDPAIAGQLQSQDRSIERDRQARRAAMAERAAAQGLIQGGASSGAFDAEVASGYEDAGQRKSDVRSQLFGRELESRRQQLSQLLAMAMQSGDAESARGLQMAIAQMDNALRGRSLDFQQGQWNDQFGRQLGRDREDDFRYRADLGF